MGSDPKRLHNSHEKAQVVKSLEQLELEVKACNFNHRITGSLQDWTMQTSALKQRNCCKVTT